MSLETAIFVTTFALLGASLLLSSKRDTRRRTVARGRRGNAAELHELHELVRPALLFTTTARIAHC